MKNVHHTFQFKKIYVQTKVGKWKDKTTAFFMLYIKYSYHCVTSGGPIQC